MKVVAISKKTNDNMYDRYVFSSYCGFRASHSVINEKGTYCRKLIDKEFASKEEGNEFFKKKLAEGYKVDAVNVIG